MRGFFIHGATVKGSDAHLVRCAGCGHNFETGRFGTLRCPTCRAEIWIQPPEGLVVPEDLETEADRSSDAVPEPTPLEVQKQPRFLDAVEQPGQRGYPEVVPAWESGNGGIPRRFAVTVKQVFTNPSGFFGGLKVDRYYRAFSFGFIVCTFGTVVFCLYSLWNLNSNREAHLALLRSASDLTALGIKPEELLRAMHDFLVFSLLAAPLIGAFNLWVSAGLNHLGVMLMTGRGRHLGFTATFRATAYGFVPLLLLLLPVFGGLVGVIWSIIVQVIAIGQIHRIKPGRATLAVLLPLFSVLLLLFATISG